MVTHSSSPVIYIVSGGVGASGEQLVNTVLAQFPEGSVRVITVGNVREKSQIKEVLLNAREKGALVVHTLVESELLNYLTAEAAVLGVQAVDLMGPIIKWVSQNTGQVPLGQPGLYRQLHHEYFGRVAAIDYTMKHDDGNRPEGWKQAEAVLVGVSRTGKTPLSIYLAVLGWKVANYPLVPQIPLPDELFAIDRERVFGLTIDPGQLIQYRIQRQRQMGTPMFSAYVDPKLVYEEVEEALKIFKQHHFTIINMTDKTIEMGADEIIRHLARRFG